MKIIAIVLSLLGLLVVFYGLSVPAFIAGQYLMLGVLLLAGGIGLYIYAKKK